MKATQEKLTRLEADRTFDTLATSRPSHREPCARRDVDRTEILLGANRPRTNHALPAAHGLVFVVDAYPGLADFAKTVLEHAGFPTCAFQDRTTAWHAFAFATNLPQLLIADDSDGELSGQELIRLCREINPNLKVLLVNHHPARPEARDPGVADAFLSKPYCGPLLVQEVRRLSSPPPLLAMNSNTARHPLELA